MSKKNSNNDATLVLKPSEVVSAIKAIGNTDRSTMLWGPPGIGKSQILKALANSLGIEFIDLRLSQLEPTDLRGIPFPVEEADENGKMVTGIRWSVPHIFPKDPNSRGILLLDEFNSAGPTVQAAAYQLVLDRAIGEYKVPDGWQIIAAGNRDTDKGVTFRMPTPIMNRFIHLEMRADFDDWQQHALVANYDDVVLGYLTSFKSELFEFDPASASRGFATPRSWEAVSRLMKASPDCPEMVLMALVAGAVGDGLAAKFIAYRRHAKDLPAARDILEGKVKDLNSKDISLHYTLVTSLCQELRMLNEEIERLKKGSDEDKKQASDLRSKWLVYGDHFLDYMMKNLSEEITIMGARTAIGVFKLPFSPKDMKFFKVFTDKYKSLIMGY